MVQFEVESNSKAPGDLDDSVQRETLDKKWSVCAGLIDTLVRRYVVTGRGVDADDAAQQAALAIVEGVASGNLPVNPNPDELSVLSHTLTLRIREFLRAEHRRSGRQITVDHAHLERALARRATVTHSGGPPGRTLARALDALSPRQRAVIAGIYFDDASVLAMARRLEVTPQAITALHRRALKALRQHLTELAPP